MGRISSAVMAVQREFDREGVVWVQYTDRNGTRVFEEGFVREPSREKTRRHLELRRRNVELTHLDSAGKARMVDIGDKPSTSRMARATGLIRMKPETLAAIRTNALSKGDALAVARVAGISAAKRTWDLIPLCHQIPISAVHVDFELDDKLPGVRVSATAKTEGQTGVEMEAILAVSVSLVTLYDMAKGVDKGMTLGEISLVEKRGGKSGDWVKAG